MSTLSTKEKRYSKLVYLQWPIPSYAQYTNAVNTRKVDMYDEYLITKSTRGHHPEPTTASPSQAKPKPDIESQPARATQRQT